MKYISTKKGIWRVTCKSENSDFLPLKVKYVKIKYSIN